MLSGLYSEQLWVPSWAYSLGNTPAIAVLDLARATRVTAQLADCRTQSMVRGRSLNRSASQRQHLGERAPAKWTEY